MAKSILRAISRLSTRTSATRRRAVRDRGRPDAIRGAQPMRAATGVGV